MSKINEQFHIRCGEGEIGRYVILAGDPGRIPVIAEYFDQAEQIAYNREFNVYTGTLLGEKITACYLHDCGMGVPKEDYAALRDQIVSEEYRREHPDETVRECIRNFHQEFSGRMIRKYAAFFEIPDERYLNAIIQVSRGHRRVDLTDAAAYPAAYPLQNGNTVCLPYLAALIRLADEMDVAADRKDA